MKKDLFSLLLFMLANFVFAHSQNETLLEKEKTASLVKIEKPDACVEFSATLSCGIAVWVTACDVSASQIVDALLMADVIMCGFNGIDEVIVTFP